MMQWSATKRGTKTTAGCLKWIQTTATWTLACISTCQDEEATGYLLAYLLHVFVTMTFAGC